MSIAKLTAGPGYRYLLRHISRGDAPELSGDAMTRYYTTAGYPPGIWLGRGLSGLADGEGLTAGSPVCEEQMARLFGAGHDPVTDTALGRPYVTAPPLAERIATAVAQLPGDLVPEVRDARVAAITAAEKARPARGSVAGFDLTFSVPKSVSVLWALADRDVQRVIVDAHHAAIAVTLGLIEREVARTRTGHAGAARIPVHGLVAAGFDHHDSRAGDPQLHTHVTVANRVQAGDGRWRTLDGHALYAAGVALSDTYDALLADNRTRTLGVAWETRLRGRNRNPRRELADVPDRLIAEFSQRSAAITKAKDTAIAEFVARHHREPTGPEAVRIRQRATLSTRQAKIATRLADYARQWSERAADILHGDPHAWATGTRRDGTPRCAHLSTREQPWSKPDAVLDIAQTRPSRGRKPSGRHPTTNAVPQPGATPHTSRRLPRPLQHHRRRTRRCSGREYRTEDRDTTRARAALVRARQSASVELPETEGRPGMPARRGLGL